MKKKIIITLSISLIIILAGIIIIFLSKPSQEKIISFEQCVNLGFPVIETYPQQCNDGKTTWTEETNKQNDFCGTSTKSYCESNQDCITGGCNGEICENTTDSVFSTCQALDCFDNRKYELNCKCINNECIWS